MKKYSLLCLGLLACFVPAWSEDFQSTPHLTVKGEASVFQPSDQMEVSFGVVTSAATPSEAIGENGTQIRQIIGNLQAIGLDTTDYQTGKFTLHPVRQPPKKDGDESESGKIIRYDVVNTVQVKTQKINLADQIIDAAIKGGANQIDQIQFSLNSPETYHAAAIEHAAKTALADANSLTKALGVGIKRVLVANLDQWQQAPGAISMRKYGAGFGTSNMIGRGGEGITPGNTEIHATVELTLEIGN